MVSEEKGAPSVGTTTPEMTPGPFEGSEVIPERIFEVSEKS